MVLMCRLQNTPSLYAGVAVDEPQDVVSRSYNCHASLLIGCLRQQPWGAGVSSIYEIIISHRETAETPAKLGKKWEKLNRE